MCSIGEDDFGDEGGLHTMIKDESVPESNEDLDSCKKCGSKGTLVKLKFREAECKSCFLAYARHKFRATLGSSKILPKGAEVLLLFDGSPESLVLLDMMQYAQTQNTHKRLHVSTKILFIDQSSVTGAINLNEIRNYLSKYDFEAFIISLADKNSLCKLEELDAYLAMKRDGSCFEESVMGIKTLSSRQDFLKVWRSGIIEAAGKQLKCGYIFSPDISTNLATVLLNSISLGRGGAAALDVSLLDDRLPGLKIIRPLRNLNANEVNFYLLVNDLNAFSCESYGESSGPNASIQNLTKRFVEDLQENFSSTISTVFRTGDKIAAKSSCPDGEFSRCPLCNSQLDNLTSKTLLAIEFSRLASAFSGNMENCKQKILTEKVYADGGAGELCHACDNIQKDSENVNLFR